ncbi:hypothetical protein N181_13300 [Sinorhizobium fredii USDA 205]|uniref:Uncharacterized protein n=1 Tax=Rhizobium fredii TaxID=380 RepID=A0A2A6M424_RHIFR|nr:hypothetical protein N181_13300 [Sinorhizobium fredii USDA 205]PDT49317.1 hypothetical protein CO661_05505 [Sinorhizobium fredii]UTY49504.1 hypothetical protein EPK84_23440 [Sinorhizobium fredii]
MLFNHLQEALSNPALVICTPEPPLSSGRFWPAPAGLFFCAPCRQCMSPKSVQRFWDDDMHKDKKLKRAA